MANQDISNYFEDLFIEDERGLIIDELDVPHDSATEGGLRIMAGETVEMRSEVSGCEFVGTFADVNYILE